ncbi:Probable nuclear hormone receptor HR3 [Gryllus bimaculatus]|nr:Probable nuclear hormone receptor HR3 [Gryllus bimaculatus]
MVHVLQLLLLGVREFNFCQGPDIGFPIALRVQIAVKFGRMSKKQREKVEDEVRFHRAQLRAQTETAPDSSGFDQQMPSSSDQLHTTAYNGSYTYGGDMSGYGAVGSASGGYTGGGGYGTATPVQMGYVISADYVDSTTTRINSVVVGLLPNPPSPELKEATAAAAGLLDPPTAHRRPSGGNSKNLNLLGGPQPPTLRTTNSSGGGLVAVKQEAASAAAGVAAPTSGTSVDGGGMVAGCFVDSTTFLGATPSPNSTTGNQQQQQQRLTHHHPSLQPTHQLRDDAAPSVHPNPAQISELLAKTIADAHARTCLYTLDHIQEMFRKPQDLSKQLYYKNLAHEELWLECAQKLTTVIQQIIEFAKMVPGFMKLTQDDQIVLLKAGSFELAVLRMSRYFDLTQNCVLYSDTLLPQEAFFTTESAEMNLVRCVFEFAKSVAELKLTETELALYSACVLLQADRPGLKGLAEISRLSQAVMRALRLEIDRNHVVPIKGDVTVCDSMIAKLSSLRELSVLHMDALAKFKRSTPHLEFPALHKELFSEFGTVHLFSLLIRCSYYNSKRLPCGVQMTHFT